MAVWLDEIVSEEQAPAPRPYRLRRLRPRDQHPARARRARRATPESKIVLVIPASCWTIIAGVWPVNAFGVTVHLTPFASAAAEASGIKAALRLRGHGDTTVVVWGGDGSTCDIGFSGVSAAAERNEDIVYVLNDNEAYMNTGVQKSGRHTRGRLDDDDAGSARRGPGRRRTSPGSWRRTGFRTSRRSPRDRCRC